MTTAVQVVAWPTAQASATCQAGAKSTKLAAFVALASHGNALNDTSHEEHCCFDTNAVITPGRFALTARDRYKTS